MTAERVYVAGPIAGMEDGNRLAFGSAVVALRAAGFDPVDPHDVGPIDHVGEPCPDMGYDPGQGAQGHTSSCCFLRADLTVLLVCDFIFLLPGWENSRGASLEAAVAKGAGIPRLTLAGTQCVLCGCTDDAACIGPQGPCWWVRDGICSLAPPPTGRPLRR